MDEKNYFKTARENESIFRAIIKDLRDNINKLPRMVGMIVPSDLDTESELEKLLEKYSCGERTGKFTITHFDKSSEDCANIIIKNEAPLSGGGIDLVYQINPDSSVKYKETNGVWLN